MGRKSVLLPYQVLSAQSMASSFQSPVTAVKELDELGYEVSWTGTSPVGEIRIQVRIKNNWEDLPIETMPVAADSGNYTILIDKQSQFTEARISYIATSGVGTMNAFVTACVTGA